MINMDSNEIWGLMLQYYYDKYGETSGFQMAPDQVFYAIRDDDYEFKQTIYSFFTRKFNEWGLAERGILKLAKGNVLDVGCGSGRHSLWLQTQPSVTSVKAIDVSQLCLDVATARGVENAELQDIYKMPTREKFDTILLIGVGGLLTNKAEPNLLFNKVLKLLKPNGRILLSSCYWISGTIHETYKQGHGIFMRAKLRYSPSPELTYLSNWETSMQFNHTELEAFVARALELVDYFEGEYVESFGYVQWSCSLKRKGEL